MTTPVGFKPYKLKVNLSTADGDFDATIRTSDDSDFPAGAVVRLKFNTDPVTYWDATVSGSTAVWAVDKAEVAALVPGTKLLAHIIYSDDSGVDLVWFSGSVTWNG